MKGYVARTTRPLLRRHLRRTRPGHRAGAPIVASRRHRPRRSRKARRHASPRERNGRDDEVRSLSFGAYLTTQWLPAKRLVARRQHLPRLPAQRPAATSCPPSAGSGSAACDPNTSTALYDQTAPPHRRPPAPSPPRPSTRSTSSSAAPSTTPCAAGCVNRNVALLARSPAATSIPTVEQTGLDRRRAPAFLRAAAGHRLFPALWLAAITGMRRSELLGLRWDDLDCDEGPPVDQPRTRRDRLRAPRVPGQDRQRPPQPSTSTPPPSTSSSAWQHCQAAEHAAVGIEHPGQHVHRRRRRPHPPPRPLPDLRADRPPGRRPGHPSPRPPPHPRHPAHRSRRPGQGRQRTARTRHAEPSPSRPTSTSSPACKPDAATHLRSTHRQRTAFHRPPVPPARPRRNTRRKTA